MILENLRNAYPEKPLRELRKIRSRFYKNLSDVTLETFKLISLSEKELNRRVKILNASKFDAFYNSEISVIVTSSHICNWEWMLAILANQIKLKTDVAYQQINNPFFDKLMINIRSRFGSIPVEKNQIFRESLKKRNIPHIVALAADQSPPLNNEHVIWIKFLNQETAFYSGMVRLSKSFNWPIVYLEMQRIKRGFYEIEIKDVYIPSENNRTDKIMETYVELVETSINKSPHCWLWSHNRWKRKKKDTTPNQRQKEIRP